MNCKSHLPLRQVELVHFQAEHQECFCTALRGHLLCAVPQQQSPQLFQIYLSTGKKIAFLCALKLLIYLRFFPGTLQLGQLKASPAVCFADRWFRWETNVPVLKMASPWIVRSHNLALNCGWNGRFCVQKTTMQNKSQCICYKIHNNKPACCQVVSSLVCWRLWNVPRGRFL